MLTDPSMVELPLEVLLITSFNAANLGALLSRDEELPIIRAHCAPYGQAMQLLMRPDNEVWREEISGAIVWTSPDGVSRSYGRLLENKAATVEELYHEVDIYCEAIQAIPGQVKQIFVPSWIADPSAGRLGLLDLDAQRGPSAALLRMNLRLVERLRAEPRVYVIDAARWVATLGEKSFNPRMWYLSKTPFANDLFKLAAAEIKAAVRTLRGMAKKLIVLDLDDTLWGGVVGDLGWQNLRLGGHDAVGEAYKDFQLALKVLKQRGILLGIVSKNEERVALEAIDSHPEMALCRDDFAAWRINWQDKAQNIVDLVSELNLGLQSVLYIDDNPVERHRIRAALPEVMVPEWPTVPAEYRTALQRLRCFDQTTVSEEDRGRSDLYLVERERQTVYTKLGSLDQWLKTLDMQVTAELLHEGNLERAVQLLNKTNQMNLRTRRLTKEELWQWSQQTGNLFIVFRVRDKFGDYGLVGLASLSWDADEAGEEAELADFVVSCRVLGRKVEETMLHVISSCAVAAGARGLRATYLPTSKNLPCHRFFKASEWMNESDGNTFGWSLVEAYPKPEIIALSLTPELATICQPEECAMESKAAALSAV